MKFNVVIYIYLIFSFIGCENKASSNLLSISIGPTENILVPLSKIADKIDVVKLETTDSSLIDKNIFQVEILDNLYLIRHGGMEILVFDMQGNFVRQIGKRGKGPGEYNYFFRFTTDEQTGKIFLCTNTGIMVYDIYGNLLHQQQRMPDISINLIYHFNRDLFLLNTGSPKMYDNGSIEYGVNLSVCDSDWNITDNMLIKIFKFDNWSIEGHSVRNNFISQKNNHLYLYYPDLSQEKETDTDTVFVVNNHKLEPYATVQFVNNSSQNSITNIFMAGRYIVVQYVTVINNTTPQADISHYVYDITTKKGINVRNGFLDDIHHNEHVIITHITQKDNMFFYTQDQESEKGIEQNPILYIGMFKK